MHRRLVFILCALILAACLSPNGSARQPSPTVDVPVLQTFAVETVFADVTQAAPTATPAPSLTPTAAVTPNLTRAYPTPLPTLNPTLVPELLKTKITLQPETFNGHTLQKITGWDFGFTEFQWMDSRHLLLGAGIDFLRPEHGVSRQSHPAVINLDMQKVWLPGLTQDELYGRSYSFSHLPVWSSKLGVLITSEKTASGDATILYTSDGEFLAIHPGTLLGISPSGTKLLFSDGTWLDLTNGKQVHFAWKLAGRFEESRTYHRPIWSANEKRVFVCGVAYGDASTGDSYEEVIDSELLCSGTWILNDRYFIGGNTSPELSSGPPLFDATTKTFDNVSNLAKIPSLDGGGENLCNLWFISPSGKYVWLACFDGGHLVDITTFQSWFYPEYSSSSYQVNWSEDGSFAKIDSCANQNFQKCSQTVLSVASKQLILVPGDCKLSWPPLGNFLICQSKTESAISLLDARTMSIQKELKPAPGYCGLLEHSDNDVVLCLDNKAQTLSLLNTRTLSVQKETALPIEIQELFWSPDRKRIALLARDSSLWQIDYPNLENLEQLTPPMPGSVPALPGGTVPRVKNVTWSPDGTSLAFIGDTDIYIVDTQVKP